MKIEMNSNDIHSNQPIEPAFNSGKNTALLIDLELAEWIHSKNISKIIGFTQRINRYLLLPPSKYLSEKQFVDIVELTVTSHLYGSQDIGIRMVTKNQIAK